ncbi:MAG: hypothetical protein ABIN89_15795 [Chitinophagaceae bacterium]
MMNIIICFSVNDQVFFILPLIFQNLSAISQESVPIYIKDSIPYKEQVDVLNLPGTIAPIKAPLPTQSTKGLSLVQIIRKLPPVFR